MPPAQHNLQNFNSNTNNFYTSNIEKAKNIIDTRNTKYNNQNNTQNNIINIQNIITSQTYTTHNNTDKETVIIFDWDDTLLSSTFLSSHGLRLDSSQQQIQKHSVALKELEQSIITILEYAMNFGSVHIVTNAETGWIQLSTQKFIPGCLYILQYINIISARSTYENRYPDSPLKWKYYAFQDKLSYLLSQYKKYKNIISFGDSHVEREAIRSVCRGYTNIKCKSIKFTERPTIEQLKRQLELIKKHLKNSVKAVII